jgi:hypothetical protein
MKLGFLPQKKAYYLRVLENMRLSKIFVSMRGRLTRGWRKLNNELHNLHFSASAIRVIKSRKMRYTWEKCIDNFNCKT